MTGVVQRLPANHIYMILLYKYIYSDKVTVNIFKISSTVHSGKGKINLFAVARKERSPFMTLPKLLGVQRGGKY